MTADGGWNPRYVHYGRVHGNDPDAQVVADKAAWPGGCMCGFILWVDRALREFRVARPAAFMDGGLLDHGAFDAWLSDLPVGHGVA